MATISNTTYGLFGPFASPDVAPLRHDEFRHVLSFLDPKKLALIESVCKSWKKFIDESGLWKKHCQKRLNIPAHIDPNSFLPTEVSYKKAVRLGCSPVVFDEKMYQYYLGAKIEPAPPIPEEISLERGDEPDPCDPTTTIGRNYTWFYFPKEFEMLSDENFAFDLDKADDPNDEEAPMLIHKDPEKSEEKKTLKVPNTINNIGWIFKDPKNGNPSAIIHLPFESYYLIEHEIVIQYGNKRGPSGWICMREEVIGRGLSFSEQQEAAKKSGVVIPSLLHRVFFNFLGRMSSGIYPDGISPMTYAHTATTAHDSTGAIRPACCHGYEDRGMRLLADSVTDWTGAAVVLKGSAI